MTIILIEPELLTLIAFKSELEATNWIMKNESRKSIKFHMWLIDKKGAHFRGIWHRDFGSNLYCWKFA